MAGNDSDRTWRYFGKADPYFGVLTIDRFRGEPDDDSREVFFATGKKHIASVIEAVRNRLDPSFSPRRALDFGCGVGRLVLPLAKICETVVGVDVSPAMLEEAQSNARREGFDNVSFVESDDELTRVAGSFDFIHSYIVFQHIPPERGERILRALLSRVNAGGFGALQFTFRHDASLARRSLIRAYGKIPGLYMLRSVAKREYPLRPMMQMNSYDLNRILSTLRECGVGKIAVEFTETNHFGAPMHGAFVLFQKVSDHPAWHA